MPEIVGIMLAAGRGTRFDPTGQRNKLLAPLPDGRAVLRASCANLLPWVDRLVVVTGEHGAPLRAALADLPLEWVESDRVDLGMGASLKAGVGATDPATGWLFALGDMPYDTTGTLGKKRDALRRAVEGTARAPWRARPPEQPGVSSTHLGVRAAQLAAARAATRPSRRRHATAPPQLHQARGARVSAATARCAQHLRWWAVLSRGRYTQRLRRRTCSPGADGRNVVRGRVRASPRRNRSSRRGACSARPHAATRASYPPGRRALRAARASPARPRELCSALARARAASSSASTLAAFASAVLPRARR